MSDERTTGEKVEDVLTKTFAVTWRKRHGDEPIPEKMLFALREHARDIRLEIDARKREA